jgi:membrane protease YdiL (CAAX protease family)
VVVILGYALMNAGSLMLRNLGMRPLLVGSELLLALPSLLALALARIPVSEGLGMRGLDRKATVVCIALGVAFWAASLGLFELQYGVWKPPPGYLEGFERLHDLLKPSGPLDAVVSLAAIAFAPAICEEIVFRGAALPALLPRLGAWGAALGSAALFGLIHVDAAGASASFYRVPFAFVVGLGLAALRIRSGSLWASILAHATLNGTTFFAAPLAQPTNGVLPDPEPLLGAGLLVAGALTATWLFAQLEASLTGSEPST